MKIIRYVVILMLFFYAMQCQGQKRLLYDSLNSIRASQGLPRLKRSIGLEIRAKIWLIRMDHKYHKQVHSHVRGSEVLTQDCYDPIACWMASPPHRAVLLGKSRRIGIAIYRNYACGKLR
jgi:uncharacterized protein YkwD